MTTEQAFTLLMASYQAEVEYRKRQFIADDSTRSHIRRVAEWLTSDSSRFGMMFCGYCGNGKTTLVHAIRSLIAWLGEAGYVDRRIDFRFCNAREICWLMRNDYNGFKALRDRQMLAIDDLGADAATVMDYGNELNPAMELLTDRYDNQRFTLVTSNLKPETFREKYDPRLADRFNEMFEVVAFENETYRRHVR